MAKHYDLVDILKDFAEGRDRYDIYHSRTKFHVLLIPAQPLHRIIVWENHTQKVDSWMKGYCYDSNFVTISLVGNSKIQLPKYEWTL